MATPTKKRKPAEKKQSDWTDNFEGLWQSQPHDFLVERAFNQLLSRGQSKCCICSLFDVPSPFNTYNVSQLYSTVQCIRDSKIRSGQSFKVMRETQMYMYVYFCTCMCMCTWNYTYCMYMYMYVCLYLCFCFFYSSFVFLCFEFILCTLCYIMYPHVHVHVHVLLYDSLSPLLFP